MVRQARGPGYLLDSGARFKLVPVNRPGSFKLFLVLFLQKPYVACFKLALEKALVSTSFPDPPETSFSTPFFLTY